MAPRTLLHWIELSRPALTRNLDTLAGLAAGRLMAPSVKANAYGHGLSEVVTMLGEREDVAYVSVHSLDEAILCRAAGWRKKILVLGPIPLDSLNAVIEHDLEPVITTREALSGLGKLSVRMQKPIHTHLKLETGTNRQGVTEKDLRSFAAIYKRYPSLHGPLGASMHFANIEDTTSHEYAQYQLSTYNRLVRRMGELGIRPKLRHTASSAALLLFDKTRYELVRPGLAMYGHWPSKETYLSYRLQGGENNILVPVLTWKTRITQIKRVPADSFVGYGCTYRTTAPTVLAIVPVGYYDGYDRGLSNQSYVLVRGRRAPVRGRICMNLMMIDVTGIGGVRLEDEVTLVGRSGKEYLSVEQLAQWAGTINYEILARLSATAPRIITK